MPYVIKGICVLLRVLNQDIGDKLTLAMFRREICCLLKVATLPTHCDCCVQVKFEIPGRFDERLELLYIFQFRVAVE